MDFIGRTIRFLGPGRMLVLLLVVLAFAAGYRLATFGWLAADEADPVVEAQPTIIIRPTETPASAAGPDPAPAAEVTRRPTTAVIVPDATNTPTATAIPSPAPTPTRPAPPTPTLAPTPIPTPTVAPTATPVPTATPNPVNGWVASAVPARGIDADQLPVEIANEFRVGENVDVATEFRDVPSGVRVGIAWYRDGVEVSVWESGQQFGFERAHFAFFRVVNLPGAHTVSLLIDGQTVAEAAFTVTE